MGIYSKSYKIYKEAERKRAITNEVRRKLHRWRKRIIKKEGIRVVDKILLYKEQMVGSFFGKNKWDRRDIIATCLYTLQIVNWDDPEYHFDWEETHDSSADS